MKPKLKVTVGLCVRNIEHVIKESIDSIVNQDFPPEQMEIIVVKGSSQDKSTCFLQESLSKTIIESKIFSDEGKGLGTARQIVVDNARGEYIVWVDRDIKLSKDYIRKQVNFMDRNPKIGAAQGNRWKYKGKALVATLEIMSLLYYIFEKERKILATRGSIYRVKAIKQVGGFDENIKGAGEDIDLSARMRKAGWTLSMNQANWYHLPRETWKGLWSQYKWYGYGMHYVSHKHKGIIILWQWVPPIAFLAGLKRSYSAYKITHQKVSFLLPLQFTFKSTAWCLAYVKSHLDGYGHQQKN